MRTHDPVSAEREARRKYQARMSNASHIAAQAEAITNNLPKFKAGCPLRSRAIEAAYRLRTAAFSLRNYATEDFNASKEG